MTAPISSSNENRAWPTIPLDGPVEEIRLFVNRLRAHYEAVGFPYGYDEQGFQRWLLDFCPVRRIIVWSLMSAGAAAAVGDAPSSLSD